jgi:hypothetical protein
MQVGELALNELKVQCEDCCSQIFISKPNKFAAASISVAVAQLLNSIALVLADINICRLN